jgi:predicted amidohydrolase YtcJ
MMMKAMTFAIPLALAQFASVVSAAEADKIWFGGPILTMNDKAIRAEAVAEAGGKIVAVGSRAEIMAMKGKATKLVDLKGRTMLPGFVDAHGHVTIGGLQALSANLLAKPDGSVTDIASLQATVKAWTEANKANVAKAGLIIGFGYDHTQLKELRHPVREELEAINSETPMLLVHQSGHMGVLEESAFFNALAKILPSLGPEGSRRSHARVRSCGRALAIPPLRKAAPRRRP